MAWEHLRVHEDEVITQITLDRPDRRNALSLDLMRELQRALPAQVRPSPRATTSTSWSRATGTRRRSSSTPARP
jgi:hypothetical protein